LAVLRFGAVFLVAFMLSPRVRVIRGRPFSYLEAKRDHLHVRQAATQFNLAAIFYSHPGSEVAAQVSRKVSYSFCTSTMLPDPRNLLIEAILFVR